LPFRSASVGLVLLAAARVLEVAAGDLATWPHVVEAWQKAAPFPHVGTIAVAFLLGPATPLATNLFYSESKGAMRAAINPRPDVAKSILRQSPVSGIRSSLAPTQTCRFAWCAWP